MLFTLINIFIESTLKSRLPGHINIMVLLRLMLNPVYLLMICKAVLTCGLWDLLSYAPYPYP